MAGESIRDFLTQDHARLDALLERAIARPGQIDRLAYDEFRRGLLKHIAMEEKILLPAAQRIRGGEALPTASRLRLDHGALASLLVPTPNLNIVAAIRHILHHHNQLEEEVEDGVYATCERLAGAEARQLLAALRAAPDVPVAHHVDGPKVMAAARRSIARAGYDESLLDRGVASVLNDRQPR
jgi:hemerythrin HHE cation binding domain-containing protein